MVGIAQNIAPTAFNQASKQVSKKAPAFTGLAEVSKKVLTNPRLVNIASSPAQSINWLIFSNMIFRPIFAIAQDPKDKANQYSAGRELFHEGAALGAHAVIIKGFEQLGVWLGKKAFPNSFKGIETFKKFHHQEQELLKVGKTMCDTNPVAKGCVTAASIVGSILTICMIIPKLNNFLLPPILKAVFGFEAEEEGGHGGAKKADGKEGASQETIQVRPRPASIYALQLNDGESLQLRKNITASDLQTLA